MSVDQYTSTFLCQTEAIVYISSGFEHSLNIVCPLIDYPSFRKIFTVKCVKKQMY